jgi:hypothetical protein
MQQPTTALTLQFLTWIAEGRRTYAEAIDAWRSSCPRLSIWEDAVIEGLVRIENADGRPRQEAVVVLTGRGRAVLAAGNDAILSDAGMAAAAE